MPKVLVVDDDRHIRDVVSFALRKEGFAVVEAGDGAAALACAEREKPDLLVLGCTARTALWELLVGSVAKDVLRGADADVLLMPTWPPARRATMQDHVHRRRLPT